jgi:hypothetical protein
MTKNLNHERVVELVNELNKSVGAVAKRIGMSYMAVRRVLIIEGAIKASSHCGTQAGSLSKE